MTPTPSELNRELSSRFGQWVRVAKQLPGYTRLAGPVSGCKEKKCDNLRGSHVRWWQKSLRGTRPYADRGQCGI